MKKLFSEEMLINYVSIFYIISIFLDLHIFYNSISTLIRVGVIGLLFLIIFIKYASIKERKLLILYYLFLILYIILHLWHINNFAISFPLVSSTSAELLYFLKMTMNILLIYIIYKLELNKNKFYNLICISSLIISLSIIIPNIFKVGYTSYDFNKITYNIFDWFGSNSINFSTSSSKGYFHLANQIVAILILYLPIILISLKEKIKVFNTISLLSIIVSLFILGTRVSTYSIFIILVIAIIVYIITSFVTHTFNKRFLMLLIILIVISGGIYSRCPLLSRNAYYDDVFNPTVSDGDNATSPVDLTTLSIEELKKELDNSISKDFYEYHYPVETDREFYENYLSLGTTKISDARFLELSIIKRVVALHNDPLDKYLGIGYDRIINIFNIESDYTMQYYSLGIIGTILLLGINILLLIYMYFKTLFNLKRHFNFENIMLMFASTYFLASAYFTGNILNAISCIIPISFVIGFSLSIINKKEIENEEYYLGIKTTTKDKEEIVKSIFKEKEQVIIYNVNPLIVNNFYKNKKIKREINKGKYNIPDGIGISLVSKLTGGNIKKSIPGIELMEDICKKTIEHKYRIFLYGAKEESVLGTKKELTKKYSQINIVGYINGYTEEEKVLKAIQKSKCDVLFVALGSPKQEEFIINNQEELKNIKIIMPVGGSFDVLSGNLKRAPKIFQKLKIEWLYRMIKEPKRLKQIFSLMKFTILVLFANFWYNENDN